MPKWKHISKKTSRKLARQYARRPLEVREWTDYDSLQVKLYELLTDVAILARKSFWSMTEWLTHGEGSFVEFKGLPLPHDPPDSLDKP